MVVRPFAATFSRPEQIPDLSAFLATVKEEFNDYRAKGYFGSPQEPGMYIYQVVVNGKRRTGLIAAVSVQDYLEERVRRHEHTLVAKEIRQAELLEIREAVVKPILLAHRHHQGLADLLGAHTQMHPPMQELHLSDPQETHRFWAITEPQEIEQIQYYFGRYILNTYIADGHHRFSAIARLYQRAEDDEGPNPFGYLMCALFPSTSLEIHNFNRVVKNTNPDLSSLSLMARISQFADLEPIPAGRKPKGQHELVFYLEEEWFSLRWREKTLRKNIDAGLPTLDVSMLNYYLLQKILGFEDIRNDRRIKYIEGPAGLTALVEACENRPALAFCLHPLSWDAFFRVIDHGLVLPPKSTWFEPRMRNGLVVQMV